MLSEPILVAEARPINPHIRAIWERFLEYELGHVRFVADLFQEAAGRDAAEILPERLPEPIRYQSHREFVRETLRRELTLSAAGTEFVDREQETAATRAYRDHLNSEGSPPRRPWPGATSGSPAPS
jgi:hypothetical protein